MQIIAVANQKGGCGKTTTAINLSAALAKHGHRVLLVDFDPQGHATLGLGYDPNSFDKSAYHVMVDYLRISAVAVGTRVARLHLLPSNILLGGAELALRGVPGKELILGEQLRSVARDYDFCVIDCSPSLGLLMLNALVASTGVLIPVQAHFYSLDGLKRILDTMRHIRARFYPCRVAPLGVVLTFVEDRTALSKRSRRAFAACSGLWSSTRSFTSRWPWRRLPARGRRSSRSHRTTKALWNTRPSPRRPSPVCMLPKLSMSPRISLTDAALSDQEACDESRRIASIFRA